MGLLARLTGTTLAPPRARALTGQQYAQAFFSGEAVSEPWLGTQGISPELAVTLSYVYSAALSISDDFGTSSVQMFRVVGENGRERVPYTDGQLGRLAWMLRWQPNAWQTAKAFWSTLAWQYLLRPAAYAEIVYGTGVNGGYPVQLIPRHPDRVRQETLKDGTLRFKLLEPGGGHRYAASEDMLVVRNTSSDGLNAVSRIEYGARALKSALGLQEYTNNYFAKGATASLVATYKGEQDEEMAEALHKSITRYVAGTDNAGGVLLIPQDIDIKALGVDPEKSELLGLKNLSGRDVARMFKMPPSWLGIENSTSYASQVQDAANYVNRAQMPMVVEFEQAVQMFLLDQDRDAFVKWNMDYLLRGDLLARMQAYEIGIRSRVLWPSECRVREDYSPDPRLDALSERDHQPGGSAIPRAGDAAT